MIRLYIIFIFLNNYIILNQKIRNLAYTSYDYPSIDDYVSCRRNSQTFICDPDSILSTNNLNSLNTESQKIYTQILEYKKCSGVGVKLGIVLLKKLSYSGDIDNAFKDFCNKQLEKWSLAKSGNCDNAIMISLSIEDRYAYIQTRPIAQQFICTSNIGEIINAMKEHTKNNDWYNALLTAQSQIEKRYNIIPCPYKKDKKGTSTRIILLSVFFSLLGCSCLYSGIMLIFFKRRVCWFHPACRRRKNGGHGGGCGGGGGGGGGCGGGGGGGV